MTARARLRDLLHLMSIPKISDRKVIALVEHFGSSDALLSADPKLLIEVPGIRDSDASLIRHTPVDDAAIDRQFSLINKLNGSILSYWDPAYPALLRTIYDPPPLLFVRGAISEADHHSIAIVGTRHPTHYGTAQTERFAEALVRRGITVVSGLARGVDTVAHTTVLRNGGRTVAVLGGSVDKIYPRENERIVQQIESTGVGAVISELPMGTPSHPGFFPRRNRIISGMSAGTLIIESDRNGGAMITAATALDQNRELFCLPGPVSERKSNGPNMLIRKGQAKLIQTVDDIIEELIVHLHPVLKKPSADVPLPPLTVFEQLILDHVSPEPVHIDRIAEQTRLSSSDVLVNLLGLEFKGVIRQLPGKFFIRTL